MTGVIYARYSCEKQTENSILGQVRECSDFAKRNNIEVINIYKDEAISGRTAEKRPSFMKMINDASLHIFDCIIVWKGDRFSRSRADAAKYKSELKKLGVAVLSATEANVTGPEAVLMDGINEAFAEYFSVELAAKVERGMTQNAIDGKFNGGTLTLGYKKDENGKIIIDEDKAFMVKEIYDLYVNKDKSIGNILKIFNEKGYTNQKGKRFSNATINRMIKNSRYIGHYDFKGTENNNMFPALIDEETWKKAQLKCIKNKHERQKFESKDAYLLSHKLYCGECENMMTGASAKVNKKKNTCYRYYKCSKGKENVHYCNKTVNKYDIEDAVIELLVEFIWNNSKVSNYVEDIVNYFAKETPDSKSIEKLLKETDRKIANVADAIADGADRSLLVPKLNELKSLRERQVAELREINRNSDIIPKEYIESFLNGLKIKDYLSLENKRYLINTFVSRIYIYDNKHIDIFLNHRGWNTEESVISKAYNEVRLTNRSVHQ